MNSIVGDMRIVAKLSDNSGSSKRINIPNTFDTYNIKTDYDNQWGEYEKSRKEDKIFGILNSYNNDGHTINIPLNNNNEICKSLTYDFNKAIAVIVIINLYNKNMNSLAIVRFLFEHIGNQFYTKTYDKSYTLNVVNLNQDKDGFLITSIILSLVLFILGFFLIKNEKTESIFAVDNQKATSCYFRKLKIWEILWIFNTLFYYGLIIFRFAYLGNLSSNSFTEGEFHDFQNISYRSELVSILNSLNILFYFIILFIILCSGEPELRLILGVLYSSILKLLPFIIGILFPFLMISMFILYFMTGDYYHEIYRNLSFIFINVLQSFFRGSIEGEDFANQKGTQIEELTKFTYNQYFKVMDKVGPTGYIVYSLSNYFFRTIFIEGFILSCFYLTYRNNYIQSVNDYVKKQKEKEIAERKKREDKENKDNIDPDKTNENSKKEDKSSTKEIELIPLQEK